MLTVSTCDNCYSGVFVIETLYRFFWCYLGETIENMLHYWYGDYELLERNHNYIQWYMIL